MYLECTNGLTCPPSLWRYRLPGFSSASAGLFPWLTTSRFLVGNREAELPPPRGRHASCQEMSYSEREEKQKIPPLCHLNGRLGHKRTSTLQRLHIAMASCQGQQFIPLATPHSFPLTNPCHSPLSWTLLLACLKSKPLFFKHFFALSIHLFHGLPTEWLPAHSLGYPIPLHPLHMTEPP